MASIDLDAPDPGGDPIVVPYHLVGGMRIEGSVVCPSPWGAPTVMGLRGRMPDGEELLCLINEYPVPWLRPEGRIDKSQLDLFHLRRVAVDASAATGIELFDSVETADAGAGADVSATTAEGSAGWAVAPLVIDERVRANELLLDVRGRLAALPRREVRHLKGCYINMWLGRADDGHGLAFSIDDGAAASELVAALIAFRTEAAGLAPGEEQPSQKLVHAGPVGAPGEARFYTAPLVGSVPTSLLFTVTGFELGLAFQSEHSRQAEWSRLRARIASRDVGGTDVLLLAAGAPDALGQLHRAEEALARYMLEQPEPIVTTHLKGVILHFWSTGQAWNLSTTPPQPLWPPLYTGVVPPALPFVKPAEPPGSVPGTEVRSVEV